MTTHGTKVSSITRYVQTISKALGRSAKGANLLSYILGYDKVWMMADTAQNEVFSSFSTNLKGSASRLTRMAKQGDTVAVLKVAGIVIGAGVLIYIILGWIF